MKVTIDERAGTMTVELGPTSYNGILPAARPCGCPKSLDSAPPINDPCAGVPEAVGVYVQHVERKADGSCVKSMQLV